jgi:hypothetical protein
MFGVDCIKIGERWIGKDLEGNDRGLLQECLPKFSKDLGAT